jgi:hypothetical protein
MTADKTVDDDAYFSFLSAAIFGHLRPSLIPCSALSRQHRKAPVLTL